MLATEVQQAVAITDEQEVTSAKDNLDMDLINACLFVPQAFLARTLELTPPVDGNETVFQTFSRKLQKLSENTNNPQFSSGAVQALQELYTSLNEEVAIAEPVTIEDWGTINAVLFSETMAKIQTQPEWVVAALLAPLANKEAQYQTNRK